MKSEATTQAHDDWSVHGVGGHVGERRWGQTTEGAGSYFLERSLELLVWQLPWRKGKQFGAGSIPVRLLVWDVLLYRSRHFPE